MTDTPEIKPEASRGRMLLLFANPWIGIAGSVASLLGVGLAVYFYFASVRYPELVCAVSPARAVVVKQGTASRLAVSFDGRLIAQDVTAVQLAFWNRGNEPIRQAAILQPLVLRTDGIPILEATIRKKSRDVVRLELTQSRMAEGEVQVLWNILESGDGAVVQLVYAGGPDVALRCAGVLEGQASIRELRYSGTIKSPSEQMRNERWSRWLLVGNGLLAIVMLVVGVGTLRARGLSGLRTRKKSALISEIIASVLMPIAMIGFAVYIYVTWTVPDPPFGFD